MKIAINEIWKNRGIKGFYVGYLSLVMREIPFSSLQFPFYEALKLIQIKREAARSGKDES